MQRVCPSSSQLLGYPSSSFPGLLITICRALLGDTGMVLGPVGAKPEAKNRAVSGNGRNPLETMGNHRKMWGNRYCIYIYILYWLVVSTLWRILKSVGLIFPNIWKNKKCSKPPINYIVYNFNYSDSFLTVNCGEGHWYFHGSYRILHDLIV